MLSLKIQPPLWWRLLILSLLGSVSYGLASKIVKKRVLRFDVLTLIFKITSLFCHRYKFLDFWLFWENLN